MRLRVYNICVFFAVLILQGCTSMHHSEPMRPLVSERVSFASDMHAYNALQYRVARTQVGQDCRRSGHSNEEYMEFLNGDTVEFPAGASPIISHISVDLNMVSVSIRGQGETITDIRDVVAAAYQTSVSANNRMYSQNQMFPTEVIGFLARSKGQYYIYWRQTFLLSRYYFGILRINDQAPAQRYLEPLCYGVGGGDELH